MSIDWVQQLRDDCRGRVIESGDPDYDDARQVFYGGFDRRPAAIVKVADADDVARVVTLAAERASSSPFAAVVTASPAIA